jgi:trypsin
MWNADLSLQTWASGGTTAGVSSITIHPDYNDNTLDNDIAVWHLSEPIGEGGDIGYVNLPSQGSDPAADTTTTVAGW